MAYLNLAEWAAEPFVIKLHVTVAVMAFVTGAIVLLRRKGTNLHRFAGRAFAALAIATALTSFFIHEIQLLGRWSPIHLLSIMVVVGLWRAVAAARRGDIALHARLMKSIYLWGFIVAGAFTLLPSRTLGEMFLERTIQRLSGGLSLVETALSIALPAAVLLIAIGLRLRQPARTRKPG